MSGISERDVEASGLGADPVTWAWTLHNQMTVAEDSSASRKNREEAQKIMKTYRTIVYPYRARNAEWKRRADAELERLQGR